VVEVEQQLHVRRGHVFDDCEAIARPFEEVSDVVDSGVQWFEDEVHPVRSCNRSRPRERVDDCLTLLTVRHIVE
jgi:hypothetical protein